MLHSSRSTDYAELCYFQLLFFRRRQRNIETFITHVHATVSLINLLSGYILLAVVVVCLSSLLPPTGGHVSLEVGVFS